MTLTALAYTLNEVNESRVNYIVLEGHGREDIDSSIDIGRTVGWFTTMFPVRLEVKGELASSIKHIKECLRKIPNKGIGYGPMIGYKRSLPRISFNYLGQFDQEDSKANSNNLKDRNSSKVKNFWNIVDEASGEQVSASNQNYNIIDINGLTISGELQFSIVTKFDENITARIAKNLKQNLKKIIIHTLNQTKSYLTLSDIDNIISEEYLDKIQKQGEIEGVYLANSLQQGFVYHALNQGDVDDAYIVQIIYEYRNELDISSLKESWGYAVKKYPTLRLRFAWDEEIVQIIDKDGRVDWRYIDLSEELDTTIQELKIKQIQEQDRLQRYKLEEGSLFRVYLIKQREDLYTCIFSNYHAILDGWSTPILLDYIHGNYLKLKDKETILFKIDSSYENAQKYLQEHQYEDKDYWDKYLSVIEEQGDLSTLLLTNNASINDDDTKQIRMNEYKHIKSPKQQELTIKDNLYLDLKILTQKEGITLNAVLQYVWHKILHIYSNSNQTIVGTTLSGRNIPINDIEASVGLHINTLPLIVDHKVDCQSQVVLKVDKKAQRVIESIKNIQDNINEINNKSSINLGSLKKRKERLFDCLFIYDNYPNPIYKVGEEDRIKISFIELVDKMDYPLAVIVSENGLDQELKFIIKYAGELFDKDIMNNLPSIINTLLEQIVTNPNLETSDLNYLDQAGYQQIIHGWNNTDKDYLDNKTIHKLFEEQVERTPDNIAIAQRDHTISYRELNIRANKLANYIRKESYIKPDTIIALCLDRNEYTLIAILATLKAGAAYVPMDSSYPDDRIAYILKDTNTNIVLTNQKYEEKLEKIIETHRSSTTSPIDTEIKQQISVLAIDSGGFQKHLQTQKITNPITQIKSTNIAYIIYTSGTTGNPKGVMIEHKSYVVFINSIRTLYFSDTQAISTYSITNYVFDIFGLEFGLPMLSGGKIEIGNNQTTIIDCSNFDFIQMTPSLCSLMLDCLINHHNTKLFIGGEKLEYDLFNIIYKTNISLIHLYGPTETTIWSISKEYINEDFLLKVSLGKPLNNETCFVLDVNLKPLPIGAIGELYIGGIGLARGYLNRPGLTAERFVANPFASIECTRDKKNLRLYKTGDLVRWLPCGNLEYIGRNDFQVKIRGYRIELGEVENVLSSYEGIKQSVVLAREHKNIDETAGGSKYLVGYYVSDNKLSEDEVLNYLQERLPEYMVPSILVNLEELPLTINGKLDRKALPDPEFRSVENYVAPRNEVERKVCQIWAEVLGLSEEKVGIHDNFFKLGGNSILSIKLASKISKELNMDVNLSSIFVQNTINKFLEFSTYNFNKDNQLLLSIVEEGEL